MVAGRIKNIQRRVVSVVLCFILVFGTSIDWTGMGSSANKHFVQFGISEVKADYNGEPTYIKNIGGKDYVIQVFKSSGTFIVPSNITSIDVTIVGGGGSGASGTDYGDDDYIGGGGGGGYVVNQYNLTVTPMSTKSITVGSGGSSSKFDTITAARGNNASGSRGGTGGAAGGNGSTSYRGYNGQDGTKGVDDNYYGGGGGGGGVGSTSGYGIGSDGLGGGGNPNTGGGGSGGGVTGGTYRRGDTGGSGVVIVRWLANVNPTLSVTTPTANSIYSEVSGYNTISLTGTVSDPNTGDIITTKYNIDGGTTQTVSGTVTTSGSFTTTSINAANLAEGAHTLNVWAVDNQGLASTTVSIPFKIDRTAPVLGTVTVTATTNSIKIAGSATDAMAGLPTNKYQYTLSTKPVVAWTSVASQTFTGLTPNTQYTAKFEAKDAVGHISS
uniref:glycine-rich domain-containing protein n=1 Tax=Lutispora sp. TaxID=2828727 RepID=UPI00356AFDEF